MESYSDHVFWSSCRWNSPKCASLVAGLVGSYEAEDVKVLCSLLKRSDDRWLDVLCNRDVFTATMHLLIDDDDAETTKYLLDSPALKRMSSPITFCESWLDWSVERRAKGCSKVLLSVLHRLWKEESDPAVNKDSA